MLSDQVLKNRVSDILNQRNLKLLELGTERVPSTDENNREFEQATARVLDNGKPKTIVININLETDDITILPDKTKI